MQELIKKIREAKSSQKCEIFAQVYERVIAGVERLRGQLEQRDSKVNYDSLDKEADQLEQVLLNMEAKLYEVDVPTILNAHACGINPRLLKECPECLADVLRFHADYTISLKNLKFYSVLDWDGKTYVADYDGREEFDDKGEDFNGKRFEVPSLADVMSSLTTETMRKYKKMKEKGLEPRLQLTPLALKLRTLAGKFDAKKNEINARAGTNLIQDRTYIWDEENSGQINETTLLYEPQVVETSSDGKKLLSRGGLTKSQLIRKYKGWLVEIVSMKQELEADPDKIHQEITNAGKTEEVEYTNAEKFVLYMKEARAKGDYGLGYENYLTAQMNALAAYIPVPIDQEFSTILPESVLIKMQDQVGIGGFNSQIGLGVDNSDFQRIRICFRRSVRIKINT